MMESRRTREFANNVTSPYKEPERPAENPGPWKYRPPPKGLVHSELELCRSFRLHNSCRLGSQCTLAHGPEELYEWSQRCKLRQKQVIESVKSQQKSFLHVLQDEWNAARDRTHVFTTNSQDIHVLPPSRAEVTLSTKPCRTQWVIQVYCETPLLQVALLHNTCRDNFKLLYVTRRRNGEKVGLVTNRHQEWHNSKQETSSNLAYFIVVKFKAQVYGVFQQEVVFSFGEKPYVIQNLKVNVCPSDEGLALDEDNKDLTISSSTQWTDENSNLFRLEESTADPHEKILLQKYPPLKNGVKLSSLKFGDALEPRTYRERMHGLLCVEELAQARILSKFNLTAKLAVFSDYILHSGSSSASKYSQNGQLYGKISLNARISEDTPAGRLILNNCSTAFVSLDKAEDLAPVKRRVYECIIEDKTKGDIYLKFSARMVADLNMKSGSEYTTHVQFQLNRTPFCTNHWAIDQCSTELLFPDTRERPVIDGLSGDVDCKINEQQRRAISAIATSPHQQLAPVIISGPFGTGKTFTFAKAIEVVLRREDARILLCTHSNSAADLYVKDYLDPLVKSGLEQYRPLRIFYKLRWIATVHPTVLEYALLESASAQNSSFRTPTREDIDRHRIVVSTLSTAGYLLQLGLPKGYFSHIMIDEAAQGTECDVLLPLSLADTRTRIALAGDHMQLSPEIFSQVAREKLFQVSLLERLYDHYPPDFPCRVILCCNYRSHAAIVQFTSELFYENKLQSCSDAQAHQQLYPLSFFAAKGSDVQDASSTSFYNNAEVYEVTEQVAFLLNNWPEDIWGKFDSSSIGVVTPYADQVSCIRAHLRKKRLFGVNVERVLNVQGKQYRVIIISTVRTRATCVNEDEESRQPKRSILEDRTKDEDEEGDSDEEDKNLDEDEDSQFGFLSSARLFNTALTRARSLVIVVGDPLALCSVGKCRKLWERFMEVCRSNGSFNGLSWLNLRSHLDALEMKKLYGLNPLAPEFVPSMQRSTSKQILPPHNHPVFMTPPLFPPPQARAPPVLPPWYAVGLEQRHRLEEALLLRMLALRKPPPQFNIPPPANNFPGSESTLPLSGVEHPAQYAAAQLHRSLHFPAPGGIGSVGQAQQLPAKAAILTSPVRMAPLTHEAVPALSQRPISKPLTVQQLEAALLKKEAKQEYPSIWPSTTAKEQSVWEPFGGPPLWDAHLFKTERTPTQDHQEEKNPVPLYLRTSSSTSTASDADMNFNLDSFLSLTEDTGRSSSSDEEETPLWDESSSESNVDYEQSSLQFEQVLRGIRTADFSLHED